MVLKELRLEISCTPEEKEGKTMIGAIYSRFSTDKQNESSIADQIRTCTEFARENQISVVADYSDEGISGAALGNRPGAKAILEAAFEGQFDVVLVTDLSRLSRSNGDLSKMIDRLVVRGIRVIGVQDGYDSSRRGHKLQAGLSGIMGEAFRDMIRERTYSAMESRARAKRPTGGKCYGYKSIAKTSDNPSSERTIEIEPNQAKIVERIFSRYIEGTSYRAIASELNKEGVPSPGSTWKRVTRRKNGWMGSGIRAIVQNVRYTGLIRWNTSEWVKDPDTGKRMRRERPRSEWLEHRDESLRVISDATFERAQQRARDRSNPDKRLKCGGRPKYLLSGLLKCKECESNYVLTSTTAYQCSGNVGGACTNNVRVRRDVAEAKILGPVREELLSPERVNRMAQEIEERWKKRIQELAEKSTPEGVQALDARIKRLEERLSAGDPDLEPDELQLAIEAAQRKRQELIDAQPAARHSAKILAALPNAAAAYKRQIERGLDANPREASKARAILRDLLGPIQMCPGEDGSLWAEFDARPAALLKKAVGTSVGSGGSGGRIGLRPFGAQLVSAAVNRRYASGGLG
jgi:DNA invertase Pin-like site-specific DNA recombinase